MAYNELIKNFERTRSYLRDFYVYGYKNRSAYQQKSSRSYDEERRRIESWLSPYVQFHTDTNGKHVYLAIDSRKLQPNPLFQVWKTKSFTAGDITLHFILFDILADGKAYTLAQIIEQIDAYYLALFENPKGFDISTVRKKLNEYGTLGCIHIEKCGKEVRYQRKDINVDLESLQYALQFFSEILPCGAAGNFILDKLTEPKARIVAFKHHYVTQILDSEMLYTILEAITQQREITISVHTKNQKEPLIKTVIPIKVLISAQNGRQYVLAYDERKQRIYAHRIDYITGIQLGNKTEQFSACQNQLKELEAHMWGVSTGKKTMATEHVEFTIQFEPNEFYIYQRMLREKRCGTVERLDATHCKFSADVYDTVELFPWIRTFLCRITDLKFSNQEAEALFRKDVHALYQMYGMEEM